MLDACQRNINYLRISVTDRCNLRCVYCMPAEGVNHIPHEEILTIEEMETLVQAAAGVGIRKVRLTGGEPLVRKGVVKLIRSVADVETIDDIAITTNGMLLEQLGPQLREAGLRRVNISLDTLNHRRFKEITRVGRLQDVKNGIETALKLGLHPVKLNAVVVRGVNDDEIIDLAKLAVDYPLHMRFIELMPIGQSDSLVKSGFVSAQEVSIAVEAGLGKLQPVNKPTGAGPASYYRIGNAPGTIGFITAISNHFCTACNRLRLTATGSIRPCLYSDRELDIKTPLRSGASLLELSRQFVKAAKVKPNRHNMSGGWKDKTKLMSQIGG
ncbi:MAG: GTP 3',8-cyclase MoaA [Firmicutes bacterium]|nr:GTP 3',8-cyclase MoaA [Bacillota bacterium]